MHPSKSYRSTPDTENLNFADKRGFGVWVISGNDTNDHAPVIASAPFYMVPSDVENEYPTVKAHLMKDNAVVQRLLDDPRGEINCTIIVSGPDGYVSPDWYEMEDQVPTWNYVTVHLKGTLRLLPKDELHDVLDSLSQKFEKSLEDDKPIWTIGKMPSKKLHSMMSILTPIALRIDSVDSTWKLAQAKPQASRAKVAQKMMLYGDSKHLTLGTELAALSSLHDVPFTGSSTEIEKLYMKKRGVSLPFQHKLLFVAVIIFLACCIGILIHHFDDEETLQKHAGML